VCEFNFSGLPLPLRPKKKEILYNVLIILKMCAWLKSCVFSKGYNNRCNLMQFMVPNKKF